MTLQWLTGWWNLIFILPFGFGLLYLGLYSVSGWSFGDGDAGADIGHDVDAHMDVDSQADVGHDVSSDVQSDVDSDPGGETDAHADSNSETDSAHAAPMLSAMNWVGVGRIPMGLVLMILMLCWGAIGFIAMQVMRDRPIGHSAPVAIFLAAFGSLWFTHMVAAILGPMLQSTPPPSRRDLLGSRAEALYPIDAQFGMVCGRDTRGEIFQVPCRVEEGNAPIGKGTQVQLVAYTAKDRMFYVVPVETDPVSEQSGQGAST